MNWPFKKTIMISRCFWDYYLHVFQKDYAYELHNGHGTDIVWVDRPTRNPMVWFRERKRLIDGITVLRPWSLRNEYEYFLENDRRLFNLQISKYLQTKDSLALWSICCMHPWLSRKKSFDKTIYWPGDHFEPEEEFEDFKDYDVVMPWVGIENIPSRYKGLSFLSSTCAGNAFTGFKNNNHLGNRLAFLDHFEHSASYVGGLSWDRMDFELLEHLVRSKPNCAFLLGVKSDGLEKTKHATQELLKKHDNIRIFEDLIYEELAELVFASDVGIIPYRITGQNLRICPNKFFEYSALGKTTISTAIPAMSRFSPPARVAQNKQQFLQHLNEELSMKTSAKRSEDLRKMAEFASARETITRMVKEFDHS